MDGVQQIRELRAGNDGVSMFVAARSRMLRVAFRTLGDAAEAEDIVQDVWLRWQNADKNGVRDARAFLTTATVRLAINRKSRARTRWETSLELRPGEPVDPGAGPGALTERSQALESALLLLLEKLTPTERAAYVLREAFAYGYPHIARVIRVSEVNSRQLVTRAKKHLTDERRVRVGSMELRRLTVAFIEATRSGDLRSLEAVLSEDIVGLAPES
jgi:RNA polymerase sigma-70 factor, ECF subfamily